MKLDSFIKAIWRRLWLILLVAAICGGLGYVYARSQPLKYRSYTTIQVGMDTSEKQLVQLYFASSKTYPILESVIQKLALPIDRKTLAGSFVMEQIPNTSLLTITVTYTDPILAADIANEIANQLILNMPIYLTEDQQRQLSLFDEELDKVRLQWTTAHEKLKTLENSLDKATGLELAIQVKRGIELNALIHTIGSQLAQLVETRAILTGSSRCCLLPIIEYERIPEQPIPTSPISGIVTSTHIGAILAIMLVLGIEYRNSVTLNRVNDHSPVNSSNA